MTDADREVEDLIRMRLRESRPGDGFLGEESDADPGTTGVTWDASYRNREYMYAFFSQRTIVVGAEAQFR